MIASQVREVGDKRVGTALLSFPYHLVDAAVQYTQVAILWLLSELQPPDSGIAVMGWGISIIIIIYIFFVIER